MIKWKPELEMPSGGMKTSWHQWKDANWSGTGTSHDHEGYVQQTNKQNWTLNSNEDKEHCVVTLYIYIYEPKNVREKEATRMFLNS